MRKAADHIHQEPVETRVECRDGHVGFSVKGLFCNAEFLGFSPQRAMELAHDLHNQAKGMLEEKKS